MNKLLFAISLLVFGVGLSAQESDWSFQSEVGLGTSFLTRLDYPTGRLGGPFQERNEFFPFISLGIHLKYKIVRLDAEFYNFTFYPGVSVAVFEGEKRDKFFVAYHVSNLSFFSELDNKRKSWVYHCAGLKYQYNRISVSALYNIQPVYETKNEVGGVIPGLVLNVAYIFLRRPKLIDIRKYYIPDY